MFTNLESAALNSLPVAFQSLILDEVRANPAMSDRIRMILRSPNPTEAMREDLLKVSGNTLDPNTFPESRNAWGVYRMRFARSWKNIAPGVIRKSGISGLGGDSGTGDLGQWAELISAAATVAVSAGAQAAAAKKAKTEEKRAKRAATAEEKKAAEDAAKQVVAQSQAAVVEAAKAMKVTETPAATPEEPSKSFFAKNKKVIVGGGIALAVLAAVGVALKKKK